MHTHAHAHTHTNTHIRIHNVNSHTPTITHTHSLLHPHIRTSTTYTHHNTHALAYTCTRTRAHTLAHSLMLLPSRSLPSYALLSAGQNAGSQRSCGRYCALVWQSGRVPPGEHLTCITLFFVQPLQVNCTTMVCCSMIVNNGPPAHKRGPPFKDVATGLDLTHTSPSSFVGKRVLQNFTPLWYHRSSHLSIRHSLRDIGRTDGLG